MSTSFFIIVVAAIGFGYWLIFQRMKERHDAKRPEEKDSHLKNPVDAWLTGEVEEEEDEERGPKP